MPVVLVEVGGVARSGHEYDDRTGVSYEFPAGRYERWIQMGDRFVYQVPGLGYVGCGILGDISEAATPGRLVCDVLSVRMFVEPVPLRSAGGYYYEADTTYWKRNVYWGQGVRRLSEARYAEIVGASDVAYDLVPDLSLSGYASPVLADLVERYAVGVASKAMRRRFASEITVMHHNNPGFDLLVGAPPAPIRFVEVKGTRAAEPVFFMSEGERRFSARNAQRYTLVVVSGINLSLDTHEGVTIHDGEVDGDAFNLRPTQWRGVALPLLDAPRGDRPDTTHPVPVAT